MRIWIRGWPVTNEIACSADRAYPNPRRRRQERLRQPLERSPGAVLSGVPGAVVPGDSCPDRLERGAGVSRQGAATGRRLEADFRRELYAYEERRKRPGMRLPDIDDFHEVHVMLQQRFEHVMTPRIPS